MSGLSFLPLSFGEIRSLDPAITLISSLNSSLLQVNLTTPRLQTGNPLAHVEVQVITARVVQTLYVMATAV